MSKCIITVGKIMFIRTKYLYKMIAQHMGKGNMVNKIVIKELKPQYQYNY